MALKLPHTFVLLFAMIVLAAVATHFIPAGEYARVEREGRILVDPDSYRRAEATPAGVAEIFLAYPRGLEATSHIVFFIFIIGGAFGVIQATGAVELGIASLLRLARGRGLVVVALLTSVFAVGGGTYGMLEETLPFLPALVVLSRRLGYDDITGGAIALVGSGVGFAAAFMNPFTVGVAQGIAGLPIFSGIAFRFAVWLVMTAIALVYLLRYARRVYDPSRVAHATHTGTEGLDRRRGAIVLLLGLTVLGLVVGAIRFGWGITHMSALFLALTVLTGWVGRLGADRTAEKFLEGAASIATGALVVGLARGVLVIFDGARVTDTVLHALAGSVAGLPDQVTIVGIYLVQVVLNVFVPSGSGQAALSIPILAPLGDLVGVTRQTTVLAYQFGDGFTNILTPTQGYFMAALTIIGVRWTEWVKFIWPLQCIWISAGLGFLLVAHAIKLGPF